MNAHRKFSSCYHIISSLRQINLKISLIVITDLKISNSYILTTKNNQTNQNMINSLEERISKGKERVFTTKMRRLLLSHPERSSSQSSKLLWRRKRDISVVSTKQTQHSAAATDFKSVSSRIPHVCRRSE